METSTRQKKNRKHIDHRIASGMLSDVESELGLEGLFSGKLTHLSFDCPTNLRTAFRTETKDNGTSVCKELQKYRVSYVATSRIKKHALGNTLSKALASSFVVENLNFEQYVQSRPRRLLRGTTGSSASSASNLCTVKGCRKSAVGSGVYLPRKESYKLCKEHLIEFRLKPNEWTVVRSNDSMESMEERECES